MCICCDDEADVDDPDPDNEGDDGNDVSQQGLVRYVQDS